MRPPPSQPANYWFTTWLTEIPWCLLSRFSHVWLFVTPWTIALQAPLSMGFSRQEYWNELPWPPPEDLPNTGIKPVSLMSPALIGGFLTTSASWEAWEIHWYIPIKIIVSLAIQLAKMKELSGFWCWLTRSIQLSWCHLGVTPVLGTSHYALVLAKVQHPVSVNQTTCLSPLPPTEKFTAVIFEACLFIHPGKLVARKELQMGKQTWDRSVF